MRVLAIILFLTLGACDGIEDDKGWIEGTYTLPNGTSGTFRDPASARAFFYGGLGTSDVIQFGTQYRPDPVGPEDTRVYVRFAQGGLEAVSGRFSTDLGSASGVIAHFTVESAQGSGGSLRELAFSVVYASGTLDLEVEGDVLRGTFDLEGSTLGIGRTDSTATVMGQFEVALSR